MAVPNIPWREPISFVRGDTLQFNRHLSNYPGSQGWTLVYELRGGTMAIEFTSVPLVAGGDDFSMVVPPTTTEGWTPGEYILVGYAVNATTNPPQRFQFFENALPIHKDFQTLDGDANVTTHYQRMVEGLKGVMEGKAIHDLKLTKIEMTTIERIAPMEMADIYARYYQLRQNEIDGERARAGLPSRNKITPRFNITGGCAFPGAGRGWGGLGPYEQTR